MPLSSTSSFRRSGQRADRRRRLLADELAGPGDRPACRGRPEDAPAAQKSEHYGNAEFLQRQLRLLDLAPRRMGSLVLLLATAAAVIAGVETAYAWMIGRIASGHAMVTALDLAARNSLGSWFSSLLLLTATAAAILIYSVRRHRTDDYQGRYRVWLWAATCCFFMSGAEAASLREGFRDLMIALTGTPLVGDGTLWWAILDASLLGIVGSRVLMDVRSSRPALGALLIAAVAHVLVVTGRLGWILPAGGSREVMLLAGADMVGNWMLLAGIAIYARHVILDAEGLLPRSTPQLADPSAVDQPEPAASADSRRVDQPHATPQPSFQRASASVSKPSVSVSSPNSGPIPSPENHKLTKAERKALKERLVRERLERQRRGM